MSEQMGARVKEARTAAGMTQKELAAAVDGLSVKSISEAERGLRELTDEELAAIAKATGSESLLADVEKSESPEAPAEAAVGEDVVEEAAVVETAAEELVPAEAAATEATAAEAASSEPAAVEAAAVPNVGVEDILKLFNAAVPAVKEAAMSVLKTEAPQGRGVIEGVLPMVVEMLGSDKGSDPISAIISFLASDKGKAFLEALKGVLGNITSIFSQGSAAGDIDNDGRKAPGSLLTFTFLYSVAIYILLLSFYFWLIRTDIKPEKQ